MEVEVDVLLGLAREHSTVSLEQPCIIEFNRAVYLKGLRRGKWRRMGCWMGKVCFHFKGLNSSNEAVAMEFEEDAPKVGAVQEFRGGLGDIFRGFEKDCRFCNGGKMGDGEIGRRVVVRDGFGFLCAGEPHLLLKFLHGLSFSAEILFYHEMRQIMSGLVNIFHIRN